MTLQHWAAHQARWLLAAIAGITGLAPCVTAQQQIDAKIEVLQVRANFYLIARAGGNIGVQIGKNGAVVVDSGSAQVAERVLAEIRKLTDGPIRFIINTSADADHVGGNQTLSEAGVNLLQSNNQFNANNNGHAAILAHDNVMFRMSAPTGQPSPYPTAAQPSETYSDNKHNLFLNGEGIETFYEPAAHTDGDSIVLFRRSDVIMAGDIFDLRQFPVIDTERGGSVQGELAALNQILDLAIPEGPLVYQEGGTIVVPGHGRLCDQADVLEYRDMVTIVRDVIQSFIKKGMSLDQIKAADPTKPYRTRFGSDSGPWTTDKFVDAVYRSLTQKR
jgi:glyoxylase-like metal-dependent hydrolase (beta-lactamase superfamily II)